MRLMFLDLKRQYASIKSEIGPVIKRVVQNQYFVLGEELLRFEEEFADYLNSNYVVGVGSGTDGLILSLKTLGIGRGDEIIMQANGFIAGAIAAAELGATPVFVDADKDTYQIDVNQVGQKMSKKTRAILPVHLYGASCEIERLAQLAKSHKVFLIEDACQSHGTMYKGKRVGTFGDMGVFSFYPSKNLGAYGDGGALCTNSRKLYESLQRLRNYGQSKKYYHEVFGRNSRLDEIQAAILRVKLTYLDAWNEKRQEKAGIYKTLLKKVKFQTIIKDSISNYHLFIIEVRNRDKLKTYLEENGIETLIHYPVPIHLQKCFRYLNHKPGDFPVSEKLSQSILSLPMYSELRDEEIYYISDKINKFHE